MSLNALALGLSLNKNPRPVIDKTALFLFFTKIFARQYSIPVLSVKQ